MDVLALVLAALALLFAMFSFFRQFDLQRRLAEIEEARRAEEITSRLIADVTAHFESYPGSMGTDYRLVLGNMGPARAEGVNFTLGPAGRAGRDLLITQGHTFPIALDPLQEYRILAAPVMGTPPVVDIELRWTDGTGPRKKGLSLTIFG